MSNTANPTIQENATAQALLAILKENGRNATELHDLLEHVGSVERQLDAALGQLAAMRQEMEELHEVQNHPIKAVSQKAADALEAGLSEAKGRLETIKAGIVAGCKNMIAAFKQKGAAALNGVVGFLGVKQLLEDMHISLNRCMKANENTIQRIAAFSMEYHETGNHLRNMGRALVGKEPVAEVKPVGRLAKLAQVPFRVAYNARENMLPDISKAIGKLEQLEETAARKPSVLGDLQAKKELAAQAAKDAPKPDRTKAPEAAL